MNKNGLDPLCLCFKRAVQLRVRIKLMVEVVPPSTA